MLRAHSKLNADAGILLVSVGNADKATADGLEASFRARLQLGVAATDSVRRQAPGLRIACAATDTPLFVDKAAMLRSHLAHIEADAIGLRTKSCEIQLLLGADTVRRLLDPSYYVHHRHRHQS